MFKISLKKVSIGMLCSLALLAAAGVASAQSGNNATSQPSQPAAKNIVKDSKIVTPNYTKDVAVDNASLKRRKTVTGIYSKVHANTACNPCVLKGGDGPDGEFDERWGCRITGASELGTREMILLVAPHNKITVREATRNAGLAYLKEHRNAGDAIANYSDYWQLHIIRGGGYRPTAMFSCTRFN